MLARTSYIQEPLSPFDLRRRLRDDIRMFYGRLPDLQALELRDVWAFARDLVAAIDLWATSAQRIPGPERMDVALDVAWSFVEERGGAAAIRDRLARALPGGWLLGKVLGWFINEERAKALVRFILELAVRELRDSEA